MDWGEMGEEDWARTQGGLSRGLMDRRPFEFRLGLKQPNDGRDQRFQNCCSLYKNFKGKILGGAPVVGYHCAGPAAVSSTFCTLTTDR